MLVQSDDKLDDNVFEDAEEFTSCCCKAEGKNVVNDVEKATKRMILYNQLDEAERLIRVSDIPLIRKPSEP